MLCLEKGPPLALLGAGGLAEQNHGRAVGVGAGTGRGEAREYRIIWAEVGLHRVSGCVRRCGHISSWM